MFGRYEATAPLGRGGMGVVFRGRDPLLERPVAIKVLEPARELPEKLRAEWRERFFREARAAARLQHPNIVQVYDVGVAEDGRPWLVMELVEGESLEAALRARELFEPREAARIGEAVARALALAHRAQIVHRDVKPANVLRASDGSIKLMDFGIARLADSTLTQEGAFLGSPQYSAPEQVRGVPTDSRADIYSLGLLVYLLLTLRNPFVRPTFQETLRAVVQDPAPAPSSLRFDLSPAWDAVLLRALDKDPARRFASADELADRFLGLGVADGVEALSPAGDTRLGSGSAVESEGARAAAVTAARLELVVLEGPARGRRVSLDRSLEVGREAGDLVVLDATVSARHCRIEQDGDRWVARDLGSTNGTWLGSSRVTLVELVPGVVFGIGKETRIGVESPAAPASGLAAPAAAAPGTLLDAGPGASSASPRPLVGAPRLVLVVREGPIAGQRYPLTRSLLLGREEGDVVLGDKRASRKHAVLELRGTTRVLLRDLASSNGTWMGSARIREVELKAGDRFRIGSTELELVAEG